MKTLNFGKYSGKPLSEIPSHYAYWLKSIGKKSLFNEWFANLRFLKRVSFSGSTSPDGHFLSRKLENGNMVFSYNIGNTGLGNLGQGYYLTDSDGNYIRDLVSFGSTDCKQGAIDTTEKGWVTLTPSGKLINGKMLVSPYYEHFCYETYLNNK